MEVAKKVFEAIVLEEPWPKKALTSEGIFEILPKQKKNLLHELSHIPQQKRFKWLIQYWWWSRKSIWDHPNAPNEIEAEEQAIKMMGMNTKEVNEYLENKLKLFK